MTPRLRAVWRRREKWRKIVRDVSNPQDEREEVAPPGFDYSLALTQVNQAFHPSRVDK